MKKLFTYYPFYIFLCVVFWLLPVVKCTHNQTRTNELENIVQTQKNDLKTFKDESGRFHAENTALKVRNGEYLKLALLNDDKFNNIQKEFAGIKKDLRNIQYIGVTGTRSNYYTNTVFNKDTTIIHNLDTTKANVFTFTDTAGWYSLKGLNINGKLSNIDIQTNDSIVAVVAWHRKWFLGKKTYKTEIVSYNPHTKIRYSQSILVKKR